MEHFSARFPRWKRALDVSVTAASIGFFLPTVLVIVCWIKLVSPGQVLFRQRRIGFRGEPFTMYKFRTMKPGAETEEHEDYLEELIREDRPMVKRDSMGDPRLIPGGRFLRAAGLDELPQLINVIRGEMSLVGPRPCLPREFQGYAAEDKRRFAAPPGLTGSWQVNGKNKLTFSQMIELDIHYARNMSIWTDLIILTRTIPALLTQVAEQRRGGASASESNLASKTRRLLTETTRLVGEALPSDAKNGKKGLANPSGQL